VSAYGQKKIAIVHDWLVGGGAERVVMALHELYPEAPIYTAYCSKFSRRTFTGADVRVSYMQKFPFSLLRKFLPVLRQRWFEQLDLTQYDIVISSSGAEAKGIKNLKFGATHIDYCHSPTHYYWVRYHEYLEHPGFGVFDPIARIGLKALLKPMRKWDFAASQRADKILANSTTVQSRIKKYYLRDSVVVHPPVDTKRFDLQQPFTPLKERTRYVIVARLTPYKRVDLAIAACTLGNIPLAVVGDGPDMKRLQAIAGPSVVFLGFAEEEKMPYYLGNARGFIFPNEDDFGIVPVEAMATGTPVIAYRKGGALDYVLEGKSGVFFDQQTPEALLEALKEFEKINFDPKVVREQAKKFDKEVFKQRIRKVVESK
jgi:glycosyltransferase involved in cell wall biosynthesis